MGSKGRIPPPHLRRPLPGPGMMHPDPFGPGIHPLGGAFPPFDMLPPPEVMEQKLAGQHMEMQGLVTENQRLAATHTVLRQELAAAQQELQRLHGQIGAMKSEKEQRMRALIDKIAKMEVDLQATDTVHLELQQARTDAQSLIAARQELINKCRELTQDLQRSHSDVQQMPALMSELEGLRQEYQHCRATYDYEKKLYNNHLESLQVMENNYISMARELEKLRAELANPASLDRGTGGSYGGSTTYNENEAVAHHGMGQNAHHSMGQNAHHSMGQNAYEDGYGVPQGRVPSSAAAAAATPTALPPPPPPYGGGQPAAAAARSGYETAPRGGPGYETAPRGGAGYETAPRGGPGYETAPRGGPGYDNASRGGPGYDTAPRGGPGYDTPSGPVYEAQRGPGYEEQQARGSGGPQGQVASGNYASYGSGTPPARSGGGYEAPPRGANPVRR